jgi:alkylation response protein AidB-like acyl-CoA dehydrogenase
MAGAGKQRHSPACSLDPIEKQSVARYHNLGSAFPIGSAGAVLISTPYTLPPDSPNLRMLAATVTDRQRDAYLAPYVRGETTSAIGISEPGDGSDPAGMRTRAVRDGDDWLLNGRKIWITRAAEADFTIVMAVTDREKGGRGGVHLRRQSCGCPCHGDPSRL